MIYTVTFNPSLDYTVDVKGFKLGLTNRTEAEAIFAGGKGINVSTVLKNLGYDSTALGFLAGFTGDEIRKLTEELGIKTDFIQVKNGISRINVKLRSSEESEINGMGPAIERADIDKLYLKLANLSDGDTLVLAGSIPASMPESMYSDIMDFLKNKNLRIVVDATKDLLLNVLKYKPFLIKPNNHELAEIFGVEINGKEDAIFYAKELQKKGARNVLVSMAGEGAVFVGDDGSIYQSEAPKGIVKNSVGAGDSMVAGFLAGYFETAMKECDDSETYKAKEEACETKSGTVEHYKKAFQMGVCTGSASAFSEKLATKEEVEQLCGHLRKGRQLLQ